MAQPAATRNVLTTLDFSGRQGRLMEKGMVHAQAMAAHMTCARTTTPHLAALHDSVERASCLRYMWRLAPSGSKATASEAAT